MHGQRLTVRHYRFDSVQTDAGKMNLQGKGSTVRSQNHFSGMTGAANPNLASPPYQASRRQVACPSPSTESARTLGAALRGGGPPLLHPQPLIAPIAYRRPTLTDHTVSGLDDSHHVRVQHYRDVQHDEARQAPDEVPFLGLVADDMHGEHPADGAAGKTKAKQARLRGAPGAYGFPRCRALIQGKHGEGDDVDDDQVDAQHLELVEVPSREEAIDAHAHPHEAEPHRGDEPPGDEADDGEKPPRDVVLVHAAPTAESRQHEEGQQHPERAARDWKDVHDERISGGVLEPGLPHAQEEVEDERHERHCIDRNQVEKELVQGASSS